MFLIRVQKNGKRMMLGSKEYGKESFFHARERSQKNFAFEEFVSDPRNQFLIPSEDVKQQGLTPRKYMTDDQFCSKTS
jgi:hypothetical protein